MPEADRNDTATYLAQRTQLGSGNTREAVAPRNRGLVGADPAAGRRARRQFAAPRGATWPGRAEERVSPRRPGTSSVQYLADAGEQGDPNDRPLLLDQQTSNQPGPEDDQGPAELRGPKRDELWTTPDTKAATLAPYLDAWRHKVERIGTIHFPTAARHRWRRRPTRSSRWALRADGTLDKAVIRRSSGSGAGQCGAADAQAGRPFDPFPPDLAREHQVLRFVYEWQWTRRAAASQRFLEPAAAHPHTGAMGGKSITVTGGFRASAAARRSRKSAQNSLTNHLLIAMPSLSDPNFSQTVALICEHTEKGALGIVLNKPLPMRLSDVLSQMKLEPTTSTSPRSRYCAAAPCNTDRGFVLHRPGGKWDHTHKVSDTIQVTTSRDVLAAMARGEGPVGRVHRSRLRELGSGQLEREMRENAWLTVPVDAARGVRTAVRGALGRRVATAGHRRRAAEPRRQAAWPAALQRRRSATRCRPTVLAFDFGLKRIGIAVRDTLTATAAPRPAVAVISSGPTGTPSQREVRMLSPQAARGRSAV